MCNLIVSTTSNNEPMNRAVENVAKKFISGKEVTEGPAQSRRGRDSGLRPVPVLRNARDADATHAMGQMPS
jgi:NAD-reducing hydrogenase large subunit